MTREGKFDGVDRFREMYVLELLSEGSRERKKKKNH